MSKDQWNARYTAEHYIYGTNPNDFLETSLHGRKPGTILFPAEGEGRNAVYAASLGWQVDAFDQSEAGQTKALRLAENKGVIVNYSLLQLEAWEAAGKRYDCIALIFVHLSPEIRTKFHAKMVKALKPGGIMILEAFTKNQLPRASGGPKQPELLFDAMDLKKDFKGLDFLEFKETQVVLDEGPLHQGLADVVRVLAVKA